MKKCNNCSENKAEYLFNKDKRSKDGLATKEELENLYHKDK